MRLLLDGRSVGNLDPTEAVDVADRLPEGARDPSAWVRIEAVAPGERLLSVSDPGRAYPGLQLVMRRDTDGSALLELRRPVDPSLPPAVRAAAGRPDTALDEVEEIRVFTHPPAAASVEPGVPVLAATVDGAEVPPFTAEELGGLGFAPGLRPKAKGWDLREAVALRVPSGRVVESVTLLAAEGEPMRLDRPTLEDRTHVPTLRLNQRGEVRFQLPSVGGPEVDPHDGLRDVRRLEIELAPPSTTTCSSQTR